jgi:hypothetical protein
MQTKNSQTNAVAGARALVAAAERTLKELARSTGGLSLSPLEVAEAMRTRQAYRRLLQLPGDESHWEGEGVDPGACSGGSSVSNRLSRFSPHLAAGLRRGSTMRTAA